MASSIVFRATILLIWFRTISSTTEQECKSGVYDCKYNDAADDDFCADYDSEFEKPRVLFPAVVFSGMTMCLMAFNIGANDVANAWATSVGSGAIGISKATIIAGLANWIGAVSLGSGVSSKVSKAVADIHDQDCWACGYCDSKMTLYGIGMVGALIGASVFLLLATFTKMPVSTTHAVVGGIVGMTMAGVGGDCVNWSMDGIGSIIVSWVASPGLSGIIAAGTYLTTEHAIMLSQAPLKMAVLFMPFLFTLVTFVMIYMIMIKANQTKDLLPWVHLTAALIAALLAFIGGLFINSKYLTNVRESRLAFVNGRPLSQEKGVERLSNVEIPPRNDKEAVTLNPIMGGSETGVDTVEQGGGVTKM